MIPQTITNPKTPCNHPGFISFNNLSRYNILSANITNTPNKKIYVHVPFFTDDKEMLDKGPIVHNDDDKDKK